MPSIEVNGAELAYDVAGQGDPLIFIHGFLARSTGDYYAGLKARLTATNRVFFLDMRSHGGSAAVATQVTLDQCARDIVGFAATLQIEDAVLVGHSMGGYLSMAAAIHDPGRFKALALMTAAASKGQAAPEAVRARTMAARRDRELMDRNFAHMFVRPPSSSELAAVSEAALCMPDAVFENWMVDEWPNSNLEDRIASIGLPVLSLIGARDVVVPAPLQYADAMRLSDCKVVTFTGEGHMLPIEQPDRCANEIHRFLADLA